MAGPDAEGVNASRLAGSALTGNIGEVLGGDGSRDPAVMSAGKALVAGDGMHHFGGAIVKKEVIKDEEL